MTTSTHQITLDTQNDNYFSDESQLVVSVSSVPDSHNVKVVFKRDIHHGDEVLLSRDDFDTLVRFLLNVNDTLT